MPFFAEANLAQILCHWGILKLDFLMKAILILKKELNKRLKKLKIYVLKTLEKKMKITKRSDLFREYARVVDMCEGTKVKPENCVKWKDGPCPNSLFYPSMFAADDYKFALAIVEDKPVFVGDVLYEGDEWFKIIDQLDAVMVLCRGVKDFFLDLRDLSNLSWRPPTPKPDPYAHLKNAHKNGKRIAFHSFDYKWYVQDEPIDYEGFKIAPPERWAIVDDDIIEHRFVLMRGERLPIKIKLTKSGLDGKITAEVVEQ